MITLSEEQLKIIKEYLIEKLSPHLIIIFGSAAKGNMRPDSDIDIAYLGDVELDDYRVFMLAQALADRLGREVDLINMKKASTVFKAQIIGYGKTIYQPDKTLVDEYKIRVLKEYAKLNEERQCIFDKIHEKGSL